MSRMARPKYAFPTLAAVDPAMGAEAPGIGFAIDSNTVRQVADHLLGSR